MAARNHQNLESYVRSSPTHSSEDGTNSANTLILEVQPLGL